MLPGNFDEWVAYLTLQELPVLESTLHELEKLRGASNVSGSKIAAIVLPDPMMTLKLMRLVNANKAGAFAQRIATAEHALMMLGMEPTFNRLGSVKALEDTLSPEAQSGLLRVVTRAFHAAMQARDWAVQRLDTSVEEVYIAALLQEIGSMALWVAAPEKMSTLNKRCKSIPVQQAEQEIFGFSLDRLSAALAEQWNMPPLVTTSMQPEQCDTHVRMRCVMLASKLAIDAEWSWSNPALVTDFDAIAEARRLSCDDTIAQIHRVAVHVARRHVYGSATPAATWLPMLPGDWPDEQAEAPEVEASIPEPGDPFQSAIDEISRHLDGTLTLHDLLVMVMRGMRAGLGLERVVFALLTNDRSTLAARAVVGAEDGSPLKAFRFNMADKHLFSILMAKPQAIHLTDENREKYMAYLTGSVLETTSGRDFCAMSISLRGRVVGMFYADGGAVGAAQYEKFKKLCTQAALGMANLAKKTP